MGRTVKTASTLISKEAGRWSLFRKSLRKTEKKYFDNLIAYARRHFSAISNSGIINPFESVTLSILLEFERRLEALEGDGRNIIGCPSTRQKPGFVDKD